MPDAVLGRGLEIIGWALGVAGLVLAGVLVFTNGPVARQITTVLPFLAGESGQRLTVTLTALICMAPGAALAALGARLAGPQSVTNRWIAALMARSAMTRGRMLAVLVCLLIAVLAVVAILSLLPDIRAAWLIP